MSGLLRDDAARGALLLERLGPSLYELGRPLAERLEILVTAAATVWRPAAGSGLPTGADKARQLVDFVTTEWEELGHPCTEAAVEHALACAARRIAAHDDERAVLVHGDVHQLNALQVPGRDTFKLVDPDGMLAEAECDLGVMMRNDPVELLDGDPWARAHWLAERCGLDAAAIWEWGVVERVTSGLRCTRINLQPLGRHMLKVADRLATPGLTGQGGRAGQRTARQIEAARPEASARAANSSGHRSPSSRVSSACLVEHVPFHSPMTPSAVRTRGLPYGTAWTALTTWPSEASPGKPARVTNRANNGPFI